jgi:hypothetical protein
MASVLKRGSLLEIKFGERLKPSAFSLKVEEPLLDALVHHRLHFVAGFGHRRSLIDEQRLGKLAVMRHEMLLEIRFPVDKQS